MAEIIEVSFTLAITDREALALSDLLSRYRLASRVAPGDVDEVCIERLGNESDASLYAVLFAIHRRIRSLDVSRETIDP